MYEINEHSSVCMNMYVQSTNTQYGHVYETINEHAACALCSGEVPVTLYSVSI